MKTAIFTVLLLLLTVAPMALGNAPRVSYLDTATCEDYLSRSRTDRIHHNREVFRVALTNPGYIAEQMACAQDPARLLRMEQTIERMCIGREKFLVRNAWKSALNAHMVACNWR